MLFEQAPCLHSVSVESLHEVFLALALADLPLTTWGFVVAAAIPLSVVLYLSVMATRKLCPDCARSVPEAARVCAHCGFQFEDEAASKGRGISR